MLDAWMRPRWMRVAFGGLCIVLVGALVEALLRAGVLNRYIMPLPSDVIGALGRIVAEEDVMGRMRTSAMEVLSAGFIVIVLGVPLGWLLFRFTLLRRAVEDWVAALAAAPIVLAFPLFLVIFGRGAGAVIAIAACFGLAPIVLKTTEGLVGVRKVLLNVGHSLNMTSSQIFWKILLPSALPSIFTGVRLAWTFCLIGVIGVEFLVNIGGLGQLINDLAERYDMPGTYAAVGFVILVSVVFFILLEQLETWLRPNR